MFIGRQKELKILENYFNNKTSQIAVLYGRRRVGKSALIKVFCQKKHCLFFEGLENKRTPEQIQHFVNQLKEQTRNSFLSQVTITSWEGVFEYFTDNILKNKKTVLVFDELQWMAAKQSKLVSLIKYFWDNKWKQKKVFLILCGSLSSYMIGKVIKSKALYGRIDLEMHLKPLMPFEARQLLCRRSAEETIKYLMLFGGVPRYLEVVNQRKSLDHNMATLCFENQAFMVNEFEKIFYGQFSEAQSYLKIIKTLSNGPKTMNEISATTKIASGGGLKSYVHNLIQADFIYEQASITKTHSSYLKKYKISDEYLCFYFKYIQPNHHIIKAEANKNIFQNIVKPQWLPWLGLAFERFCVKHAGYLAEIMGFANEILEYGSWTKKNSLGAQIDLVYKRLDKVIVLCEIKYCEQEIDTTIIPEMQKKISQFPLPRGHALEKALISLYGPAPALRASEYFEHSVTLEDIFKDASKN